jgi:hypothetical protein
MGAMISAVKRLAGATGIPMVEYEIVFKVAEAARIFPGSPSAT